MNTAQLLNEIEQLPPEAQQKIEALIVSLKEFYQPVKKVKLNKNKPDFVSFLLSIPKVEEIDLERQKDYPKDIEF